MSAIVLATPLAHAAENPFASIQLPGRNLVNNGGFERGTEGWEWFGGRKHGELVTDTQHGGQSCLKVSGLNEDYRYLNQTPVYLTPGETYTLSAWMKCEGFTRAGAGSQVINLTNYGWTKGENIGPLKPDEDWTHYSVTFQAPPTSEVAGRLSYTLVIFWPIKSEGTVWIDDVQLEQGSQGTEYTDSYVGWGIRATETLSRTWERVAGIEKTLAEGFGGAEVPAGLVERVGDVRGRVAAVGETLRGFAALPVPEARELAGEAEALDAESARLSSIAFLSDPFRPVSELIIPDREPEQLVVDFTCFQGETRPVALTVANLAPRATVARVEPGELYDVGRQVRWVGTPWLRICSAPPIRGHIKTWEQFTDPLPEIGPDGLWTLSPGLLNQLVCVVDTSNLLPGEYTGQIEIASITEKAVPRTVGVRLHVVPVRLLSLPDHLEITDIGTLADYASDSIRPLGLNTFSVPAQWTVPDYDAQAGKATVDFTRIDALVRDRLARCPEARFWVGFGVGAVITAHAQRNLGIAETDPRFDAYMRGWTRAVVEGFGRLGVGPERLIFETVDEPGAGQMELAARVSRLVHAEAPQVRTQTYVTSFHPDDEACARMYETHDIIGLIHTSVTDASVAYLRERGKQTWVYDCQGNAEEFDPIAYYRLMPWLAHHHRLDGWGHFSWLDSMSGRNYVPWEGVAEQSLVYPALDGGQIISRRWLAIEAGMQDYRALDTLGLLAGTQAEALGPDAAAARTLIEETSAAALALPRDGREYFKGLKPGADASLLPRFREESARLAGKLVTAPEDAPGPLFTRLVTEGQQTRIEISAPRMGRLRVRYLCEHRLPWHIVEQTVPEGASTVSIPRPESARVSRCIAELVAIDGLVSVAAPTPVPVITVDSELPPYSIEHLNDGLAMPGMKFEPEHGWMSSGAATEHWAGAQLPSPMQLRGVRVWWMTFGGLPQAIKVQVADGDGWKDAPGFEQWRPATSAVEELTFAPVTTDRVRVVQNAGGGNIAFPNLMGLSELEVIPTE